MRSCLSRPCPPVNLLTALGLYCAGLLTMVLDFGSFMLDSDASSAADLPAEEAALYMGFKLSARNISSFLVDGAFSWALLNSLASPKSKQSGKPRPQPCRRRSMPSQVPQRVIGDMQLHKLALVRQCCVRHNLCGKPN